jgi:hypothetical protein
VTDQADPRRRRREDPAMTRLTLRYARYALSCLTAVAFYVIAN